MVFFLSLSHSSDFYRVTVNFENVVFTEALEDRNNEKFIQLSARLKSEIEALFTDIEGVKSVTVLQYRYVLVLVCGGYC